MFLACLALPLVLVPPGAEPAPVRGLAAFSCLLITKDEFVHQRLCTGGEHWVHAVLFILHPLVLIGTALLWIARPAPPRASPSRPGRGRAMLRLQVILVGAFLVFQVLLARRRAAGSTGAAINNAIYDELGERWYTAQDDPVALLRAESRLRTAWILDGAPGAIPATAPWPSWTWPAGPASLPTPWRRRATPSPASTCPGTA